MKRRTTQQERNLRVAFNGDLLAYRQFWRDRNFGAPTWAQVLKESPAYLRAFIDSMTNA